MPIKPEHLDELLAGYEKPEDLLGENGLSKQLKKAPRKDWNLGTPGLWLPEAHGF